MKQIYKHILLFTFFCCSLLSASNIDAQNWAWAIRAGSTGDDVASSIVVGASGHIYVTGGFTSPTITFGSTTLTNIGTGLNMFLTKYDAMGNVIWAKGASGSSYNQSYAVTTDVFNNIYVAGLFYSPPITFGTITLPNTGLQDAFLVKYDTLGNVLWAKSVGGTRIESAKSLVTDASGNVYMTGYFYSDTAIIGTATLINDTTNNSSDLFLIKYDRNGNLIWAQKAGGTGDDYGNSITLDALGNIYLAGEFYSPSITFGSTILTNAGISSPDMFIAKYDTAGNILWAKSAGGTNFDLANSVAYNASGYIYVTGWYSSSIITFGSNTLANYNSGTDDVFLVKYDLTGNVIWAKSAGGMGNDDPTSVITDAWGDIYVAGGGSAPFSFGTFAFIGGTFLLKYDASGGQKWGDCNGMATQADAYSLATSGFGDVYVAGDLRSNTIAFGATTLTNAGSGGTNDMFLAKLVDATSSTHQIILDNANISIRPNPATTSLTITSTDKITDVTITNLIGQTIYSNRYYNKEVQVDISTLPVGMYLIRINGTEVRKFVKE